MAKITDGDDLVVSSNAGNLGVNGNIWIDTTAKTFTLAPYGSLTSAKEGVTLQALYSKFIKLWDTAAYNKYDFPMYAIDALSGQFQFGFDGAAYNGWKPADDTTRQMLRDGGWDEYSNAGALNRQYVGIVALASGFPAGAQFYYQKTSGGAAIDFTFTDSPNEGIQVFGDATNGNFDNRTYFNILCREPNYLFDNAVLADVGASSTGAFKVSLPIAVGPDLKTYSAGSPILDAAMAGAPYNNLHLTYFGSDQTGYDIGAYPFRVEVDNTTANATLEQIYTWLQYKLRQDADIDEGAGTVNGKTASQLMYFVGDTAYTTQGVFIDGVVPADVNRVVFRDQNNIDREYPYSSAGEFKFNSFLTSGGTGNYIVYFDNDDAGDNAGNDYGTAGAIIVNDKQGNPMQGAITSGTIAFSYDYTNNVQRGAASAGQDAPIVLVAINKGKAKPVVVPGVISESKTLVFTATAEQDRAYLP